MFDRAKSEKAAKDLSKNLSRAVTKSAARRNGTNGQDKPKPQA
jgi:hypothetical protein